MKRSFLLLALLLLFAITAHAQLTGGNITGTATDEQGRTAPGVTVDVRGTDITQTFTTDGDGRYRFLDLAPGSYKVTASLQGFTTIVRDHVIVDVGKTVDLSVQLKVSPIDEVITVGDQRFQQRSYDELFVRRADRSLILASHSAEIVRAYCARALVLHRGRAKIFEDLELALAIYTDL